VTAVAELTIEQRVDRGAAWLDECRPAWWAEIDLIRLDLDHQEDCVLGQLWGDYFSVPIMLDEAIASGFDSDHAADTVEYEDDVAALTEAWRALIERRRAEAGAAP
jgi:hypothetical protein